MWRLRHWSRRWLQASRSKGHKFSATIAKIKAKTIDGTVRDMQAKALVDRKTETLLDVIVRIMPTY